MRRTCFSSIVFLAGWIALQGTLRASEPERVQSGLSVLYDFSEGEGQWIRDRSGAGKAIDVRIQDMQAVRWLEHGLEVHGNAKLISAGSTERLSSRILRSGEVSVEAWIQPASRSQAGPARIVTFSKDATNRNFTLGQDKDKFDLRLRTTKTNSNGIPSFASKGDMLQTKLTHVVFTRNRSGSTRLYIDGKLKEEKQIPGVLKGWDSSYKLSLGDEVSGGRAWKGTYYLVALYHRSLGQPEVLANFRAGARASSASTDERLAAERSEKFFVGKIAPLLAEHCLECHDSPTSKGGLDLSHQELALDGGDSGRVIVAGDAEESLLWQSVLSDDMPADRPSLSSEEKELLREWIDGGAVWTTDFIDPALYAHGGGETRHWVQRLTTNEYIETVRTLVAVDIASEARRLLPRDLRADGFRNTAYNLNVDLKHVEAYSQLAEIIVSQIDVGKFARRFSGSRKFTDKDMGQLIEKMGQWLLRGPLEEHEVIAYRGISTTVASAGGSYEEAVGLILEAMLQSPRFIYRMEQQRGDGTPWPASEFELASRISYILWGSSPDQQLYQAAEDGALFDEAQLQQQIERMLADPRAAKRAQEFVAQWLNLDSLNTLQPSKTRFANWDPRLANDMRDETLAFFDYVVWQQDRPLAELLSAQVTFATPELAKHYRLRATVDDESQQGRLQRYDLSSDPARGGLLTQGSVLTIGGDNASMVTRGLFVLHDLLRGVVKDPPPCVDTTPIPTKPGVTQRTIASARIQNEACGGCHAKFEPLAFGLERFDGLGTFLENDEHGNVLREDGEIQFPERSETVAYSTAQELMQLLRDSPRVQQSLTWKVVQFSLGRPLTAADEPMVNEIHRSSQGAGGTYRTLMIALIKSDLVQLTYTEEG